MEIIDLAIPFAAAFVGAIINSVAGGGTFVTFPALILNGLAPIQANITSCIALWPGMMASAYGYRHKFKIEKLHFRLFSLAAILGGSLGAWILLNTPGQVFADMVPWLLLFATSLFTFGNRGLKMFTSNPGEVTRKKLIVSTKLFFITATYGGYFGAGIGIVMLALLQIMAIGDIHTMNAFKMIIGALINMMAVIWFLGMAKIDWVLTSVMIVGATLGGYVGARTALTLSPQTVRLVVSIIGFSMTAYFFME